MAAYHRLIDEYGYDDQAILAKVLWPVEWRNSSDDHLAAMALYHLMRLETDPTLLQKYRMGLNRHWYLWKQNPKLVFYHMLYRVLTGEKVVGEETIATIKGAWGFDRNRRTFTIPTPDGPKTLEADEEGNAAFMMRDYWFGRYYGIIDPEW